MTNCQTCQDLNAAATEAAQAYATNAAMRNQICGANELGSECLALTERCNALKTASDAAYVAWQNHFNSHPRAVTAP